MIDINTRRINIVISDRVNDMLDELGAAYGISKSSIAAMAIGQYVEAAMKQRELMYGNEGVMANIAEKIKEASQKMLDDNEAGRERKGEAAPL